VGGGGDDDGHEDENTGSGVFSEAMREKRGVAPQQRRAVGTWRLTPPPPPPHQIAKIRNKRVVATPRAIGDVNAKVRQ